MDNVKNVQQTVLKFYEKKMKCFKQLHSQNHHVSQTKSRHWVSENLVNIGLNKGLFPNDTNALPEPMLTYH